MLHKQVTHTHKLSTDCLHATPACHACMPHLQVLDNHPSPLHMVPGVSSTQLSSLSHLLSPFRYFSLGINLSPFCPLNFQVTIWSSNFYTLMIGLKNFYHLFIIIVLMNNVLWEKHAKKSFLWVKCMNNILC